MLRTFALGVIEGFFGEPWSWSDRADCVRFLARTGYRFYVYAPKADERLRKRWREEWPAQEWTELVRLRGRCREAGVLFGLGLTPYGAQIDYGPAAERALGDKVARLNELAPDLLAILFDDVPGVFGELARVQCAIAARAFAASNATAFFFCPTYYSDDPVFAKALGAPPSGYLEEIGERLDRAVKIFWTGPRICSTDYPEPHLGEVARRLSRPAFLWDNYPVNDGPRMCKHLHLRAFTGRSPHLRRATAGLAANPMNQAQLSKIPLATLPLALEGAAYDPDAAFRHAAELLCGPALARALADDLPLLHDRGLGAMSDAEKHSLRARYAAFDGPYAAELVRWLDGAFEPDAEVLTEFATYV